MEHAQAHESPDPRAQDSIPELVAALGITDDMTVDEPPAWVTTTLTAEQRALFARLVLFTGRQGLGTIDTMALLLFKLALQPGLPPQAAGFLVFSAAEAYAAYALDMARRGLGAADLASITGLVAATIEKVDAAALPEEDTNQDAANDDEVGA